MSAISSSSSFYARNNSMNGSKIVGMALRNNVAHDNGTSSNGAGVMPIGYVTSLERSKKIVHELRTNA